MPVKEIESADAIIVGGGNTFHLLKQLYDNGTLWAIRERVLAGVPYIGWSAGSNVACPTIRTTNDMPIVEPSRLDAMRLVPFQINPHYTDEVLPNHGGETRAQRIAEFTKVNPGVVVIGLREGSALRVIHGAGHAPRARTRRNCFATTVSPSNWRRVRISLHREVTS